MRASQFIACGTFFALASAGKAPAGHAWKPPGPNDVRSPCPAINSLANHGFIPRSGKNLTVPVMVNGLMNGMNIDPVLGTVLAQAATVANPDPLADDFDMDQLREHNFPIEHDVSLSRQDIYQGSNLVFNQSIYNQVLKFYKGKTTVDVPLSAQVIWARVATQEALNPGVEIYDARQLILSLGESSLFLSVLGMNPVTGVAPVSYIKEFFEHERLPYDLGWSRPTLQTSFATLGVMIAEMALSRPQSLLFEGLNFSEGSLRDVWELRNPITGVLINATCAAAGTC